MGQLYAAAVQTHLEDRQVPALGGEVQRGELLGVDAARCSRVRAQHQRVGAHSLPGVSD
jgi:hypothetical protein